MIVSLRSRSRCIIQPSTAGFLLRTYYVVIQEEFQKLSNSIPPPSADRTYRCSILAAYFIPVERGIK